jgi:hypothetical protein
MSTQMKIDIRKQKGYCLTCPHVPVQLVEIRRSRINPLWISKKPRTKVGECIDGRCLKCCPIKDVDRGIRPSISSSPNFHSTSAQSLASSISSCSIGSIGSHQLAVITPDRGIVQHGTIRISNHSHATSSSPAHNDRMLPPRPSRSYSGDSDSFRNATPTRPTRRPPISRNVSSNDSDIRTNSAYNDTDSVTSENHWMSNPMKQKNKEQNPTSPIVTIRHSAFDISNETIDDKSDSYKPCSSPKACSTNNKLMAIQCVLAEMKAVPCAEIFTESLLTVMESNSNDLSVQIYCLTMINNELDDGTLHNGVLTTNGISQVLDSMTTYSSSVITQGLGCDILLALASQESNLPSLLHHDICGSLYQVLDVHCRETSIVEKCFNILRILSTEEDGRICIEKINLSSAVVAAMQYHMSSASIQQDGCAVLSNLSVDIVKKEVCIVGVEKISVVVEAMQVHNQDENVMASACFALKNFAYNQSNLRCMNRTSNILEALEDAALFPALSISASQTSEKLYLSQAEDESLELHAYKVLMKSISVDSDDPEIMVVIVKSLREHCWSCSHVTECLKKLKSLALTSHPHMLQLLDTITLDEIMQLNISYPTTEAIKIEVSILVGLYEATRDNC